jgi:hypothetical protein
MNAELAVPFYCFLTGTSMTEAGPALQAFARRIKASSDDKLSDPLLIFFTDECCGARDQLNRDLIDIANPKIGALRAEKSADSKSASVLDCNPVVITSAAAAQTHLMFFNEVLTAHTTLGKTMLLTFDTEHEAKDRYGNWLRKGHVGTIATMQLYFKDPRVAPATPHCHIYHFLRGKMNTVPNGLARILDNADVLKIGHTIDKHDVPKVKTDLNCTVTPTRDTLKTAKMKHQMTRRR